MDFLLASSMHSILELLHMASGTSCLQIQDEKKRVNFKVLKRCAISMYFAVHANGTFRVTQFSVKSMKILHEW